MWKRTAGVDSKAPTRCGDGSANSACVLGPGWEFWKRRHTTEQIDRPTYSVHLRRAPAVGLLVCKVWGPWSLTRWPCQSLGRRSQSLLQPSLPCPSCCVWPIWGNRRRSEEGSESVFLSLSSVPVGFLQVTSSPLNDILSAYFIMLYQNVHFFHRTIFSGETFRCYLSLDLNILTFVKWLNKTIFVSLLLLDNTSLQVMMSKQVSLGMHICGVMVSYSFLTKRWEI